MSKFFDGVCEQFDSLPTWAKAAIGTAAIAVPGYLLFCRKKQQPTLLKKDYKTGVVYVYQFPRLTVIPSLSPYCLKLETWLRMADINYENVDCSMMTRSSKGLLPFIELNGKQYADSGFIIKELTRIFNKNELESSLSLEQKAIALAFEKMTENATVASYGYIRWVENADKFISEKLHGPLPFFFKTPFARWSLTKNFKKRFIVHGIGRHSREDIISLGVEDLKALSTYIGSKKFFGGDNPTRVDCSLFGFLAQLIYIPIKTPHMDFLKSDCQNLIQYCDRMKERFWPDWNEACANRSMHTSWKA
jgi:glutathione S-transferase